jgi:hypothetical protein
LLTRQEADGTFRPWLESEYPSPIAALAINDRGEAWVTTALDGVYTLLFRDEGADWQHLFAEDGRPGNTYGSYSVVIDRQGVVWLGSISGGIGRYGP